MGLNKLMQKFLSNRLGRCLRTTQRYLKVLTEKGQITFRGVAKKKRLLSDIIHRDFLPTSFFISCVSKFVNMHSKFVYMKIL